MVMQADYSGIFKDPQQWVVRRGVPVFCEHDEEWEDENGNRHQEKFGRRELEAIARDTNRREAETGDAVPIMLGHIPRDKQGKAWHYERDLGDIVGFARQHRVGRFGPKKKLAVLADFWFKKAEYQKAMEHPRRSVELWDKRIIDPVCLLKRTPQLDLGLLTEEGQPEVQERPHIVGSDGAEMLSYQRGQRCRIYQMETPDMDPQVLKILQAIAAKLGVSMDGDADDAAGVPDAYMGDAAADVGGAGAAMPGATNTAIPGELGDDKAAPMPYSRESFQKLQRQVRDLTKKNAKTAAELEQSRRLYQKTQRREQIAELVSAESLTCDVDEELEDTLGLPEDAFDKHLEKMRRCYQRSEQKLIPIARQQRQDKNNEAKAIRAREIALKEGISYAAAYEKA